MLLLYPPRGSMSQSWSRIYIPLCFYFIRYSKWRWPERPESTFHYASTLSKKFHRNNHHILLSTFHYASTLSPAVTIEVSMIPHLHSIMLLLYLVSFFSPYFLLFNPIFCPPSFLVIFLLKKHTHQISTMQFFLNSSSFVYLLEILHYFKSTITKSCSFYHHPYPRTL